MSIKRDIELLFEVGSLRNMQRGWRQHLATDCANDLEHTMRVVWIALMLAKYEDQPVNEEKLMKMALVHDITETRTADHSYVQKVYVEEKEEMALTDIFEGTTRQDLQDIAGEYKRRECIEAKLVKDADNLDIDIELKELAERGHTLVEEWQGFRRKVRDEKLYTQSAKKLWDELQYAKPSDWHMKANKWLHIPKAGT